MIAAPGAIRSSLRRRPAPSSVAARPRRPASARTTTPARLARSTRLAAGARKSVGIVDDARIAPLQANAEREALQPGAAGDLPLDPSRPVAQIARLATGHQHLGAEPHGQGAHVGGPSPRRMSIASCTSTALPIAAPSG